MGLAEFVEAHKQAVEHDLLTQTGYTLSDVGRSLPWGALGSFLHTVRPDSAIVAETQPEVAEWSTVFKTNVILADIYDVLMNFYAAMIVKGSGKQPKKPPEYKRSWRKPETAFKKVMKVKDWFSMIGGEKKDG